MESYLRNHPGRQTLLRAKERAKYFFFMASQVLAKHILQVSFMTGINGVEKAEYQYQHFFRMHRIVYETPIDDSNNE